MKSFIVFAAILSVACAIPAYGPAIYGAPLAAHYAAPLATYAASPVIAKSYIAAPTSYTYSAKTIAAAPIVTKSYAVAAPAVVSSYAAPIVSSYASPALIGGYGLHGKAYL